MADIVSPAGRRESARVARASVGAGAPASPDGRKLRDVGLVAGLLLSAVFLSSPSVAGERTPKANYLLRCSGCHGTDGSGSTLGGIPPFPGWIDTLVGQEDGRTYVMHVPGVIGSGLDDREIAAVMNYIVEAWGDDASAARFSEDEVSRRRALPVPDIVAYRRELVKSLSSRGIPVAAYPWP